MFGERQRLRSGAYNGADENIMVDTMLQPIESVGAQVATYNLKLPCTFDRAAKNPNTAREILVCTKEVIIDIEIHIRHVTALKLRNVK